MIMYTNNIIEHIINSIESRTKNFITKFSTDEHNKIIKEHEIDFKFVSDYDLERIEFN